MYKLYYKVVGFLLNIKFAYQRVVRGYDDSSLWDIDLFLARILPEMIRDMKCGSMSSPRDLSEREWQEILSEIADGFEAYWIKGNMVIEDDKQRKAQEKILTAKFNKGMKLFTKYYEHLWY